MSLANTRTDPTPSRRLWTIKETAQAMRISTRSVRRLIADGSLRSTRLGRCVRIIATSVDELIQRGGDR